MRLKNMAIGFLALSLLAVSLTACGKAGNNIETTETAAEAVTEETTEETSNEAEATEEPIEETVEPEVTEAPEPTEEPVVSDDPNIIDGINFTEYNSGKSSKKVWDILDEQANYDSLKIVLEGDAGVEAILSDGESATLKEENGFYGMYIYNPKPIADLEPIRGAETSFIYTADYFAHVAATFCINDDATGTAIECGAKVTYEDGTEETIKVYITKDYILE